MTGNPNRCSWCGRFMATETPTLEFRNLRGEQRSGRYCPMCRPNAEHMAEHNRQALEAQGFDTIQAV